jgi:bacillithiol system protein YtxJ
MITWKELTSIEDVNALIQRSHELPCVIFKHSTRCSISSIAKMRLEEDWNPAPETAEAYYLDLIAYRPVSQYIAETLSVYHESPQILLVSDGECTYDASHLDITAAELEEMLNKELAVDNR